ncbi:MAG: hypothetical protein LUC87_04060 [Clostridiales bacterium]|nr:hypothetical protein [Clostridiales bacterium]
MRGIMARYNYAFGYVKSYIFVVLLFTGVVTVGLGIASIPGMIATDDFTMEGGATALGMVVGGLLVLVGVYLLFRSTRKKCPQSANPIALLLWMIIAGIIAAFAAAWWCFQHIIFPLMGMSVGGSSGGAGGKTAYASGYYREGDNASCTLWTTNLNYAILKDSQGNEIEVRAHGDSGLVIDDNGNLYRPW